jgi:phospholipid/cholesterol/gamma-HCH transport system substrate-binding protein
LETTQAQIAKTSERLADLLASLEKTTNAIAEGKGTAGKFVNDPRLYDGLVDLTKSLKSTTDDLKVLIQKWSEEGVPLHLK